MALSKKERQRRERIVELARDQHHRDGEVEVDDNAKLSEGDDNGCYVQAWVWCDFSGTEFDKEHPDTDEHRASCYSCQLAYDKALPDGKAVRA